jgi:hypothetical protein
MGYLVGSGLLGIELYHATRSGNGSSKMFRDPEGR